MAIKITTEMVQQLLPERTEQEWADMRELDEELEAYEVDRLLGLRAG